MTSSLQTNLPREEQERIRKQQRALVDHKADDAVRHELLGEALSIAIVRQQHGLEEDEALELVVAFLSDACRARMREHCRHPVGWERADDDQEPESDDTEPNG